MYESCFWSDIKNKEVADMFVKTLEQHPVIFDNLTHFNNWESIKPRLINCPSMTMRARLGFVVDRILTYMKKTFPQFFLGKKP